MKTIKKLKLTELSKKELKERKMNALRGGIAYDCRDINCNCGTLDPGQSNSKSIIDAA
jgi:natural product precursor